MPTTAGEFIAFVALFVPGWLYINRRDTFRPAVKRTQLAELADVLLISALTWAIVGLVSIPFSAIDNTFGATLLSVPEVAFDTESPEESRLGWGLVYLAIAAAGARGAAQFKYQAFEHQRQRPENAWQFVFKQSDPALRERRPRVVVYLTEPGWWVRGWVDDFPGSVDEVQNRDLVLVSPIERIVAGEPVAIDIDYMILNDRDFSSLMVTFHRKHPREP